MKLSNLLSGYITMLKTINITEMSQVCCLIQCLFSALNIFDECRRPKLNTVFQLSSVMMSRFAAFTENDLKYSVKSFIRLKQKLY